MSEEQLELIRELTQRLVALESRGEESVVPLKRFESLESALGNDLKALWTRVEEVAKRVEVVHSHLESIKHSLATIHHSVERFASSPKTLVDVEHVVLSIGRTTEKFGES